MASFSFTINKSLQYSLIVRVCALVGLVFGDWGRYVYSVFRLIRIADLVVITIYRFTGSRLPLRVSLCRLFGKEIHEDGKLQPVVWFDANFQ